MDGLRAAREMDPRWSAELGQLILVECALKAR